jgi:glycosyltransferase involved in cell wall biosynthesis
MLRLLYLAFYFPPLGGGGVQRTLNFARYLPEHGVLPIVVTGPAGRGTRHAPLDASLDLDPASGCRVVRVDGELPEDARRDRASRLLGRVDRFESAWAEACEQAALRAAAQQPVDAVLATMSPFSTSRAAARVAARLGVPWVADLRDPWALDEMIVYPSRWHRAHELRRMRRSLSSAALVIMNVPEAARAVCAAFPELAARTLSLTNGYDAADFAGPPPARRDELFRIVHSGSLHVELGDAHSRRRGLRRWIGGERVPVDIRARSHVHLVRALERWRREHPDEAGRSRLVLIGRLSDADRAVFERSSVADLVEARGYLPHAETIAALRGADLLFLPMHGLPPGERARIVPGKAYEYLGARKPILAAVPEGDARDFVLQSGLGEVCAPDDEGAMVEILRRRFRAAQEGVAPRPAGEEFFRQFERRVLAERLAHALEAVVRSAPAADRQNADTGGRFAGTNQHRRG